MEDNIKAESNGLSDNRPQPAVLVLAVDSALAMFDEPIKNALYFHLKQKGVDLQSETVDIASIEAGLQEIMGEGAKVITLCIRKELDRLAAIC